MTPSTAVDAAVRVYWGMTGDRLGLMKAIEAGPYRGGEVYVVKDAKGNPVYTDRPEQLPAERLDVRSSQTDPVEVQTRYDEPAGKALANECDSFFGSQVFKAVYFSIGAPGG